MRLLAALVVLASFSQVGSALTIFVPDDYPTIQHAIDAAANGDTIVVRPGTYVENINFLGKAIAVRSERGPGVTIIDGGSPDEPENGEVVGFENGEGPDSIIDGFTLTNGRGENYDTGAASGGGVRCDGSAPTICNNIITKNHVISPQGYGVGGGISAYISAPTIVQNIIRDNTAGTGNKGAGGGIYLSGCGGRVEGNLICDNETYGNGGGIYLNWCTTIFVNNIIVGNSARLIGGAVFAMETAPTILNCTIVGNSASSWSGGVYVDPLSATITNTILWGNLPNQIYDTYSNVTYSDIEGGFPGAGNIDAKPLFADALNRDFHLTVQSPCRETGNTTAVGSTLDWEGDPRIAGELVDMGADEFYFHLYHVGDVVPGGNVEIKVVGAPGMAPVRLGVGIEALTSPRQTPYGDLYLGAPIIYTHDLGMIPATGVLVFPATIPAFWIPGDAKPMQALVGTLGCPFTRLTNMAVLRAK